MATNRIAKAWGSLKVGITGYDFFVNFMSPMVLLVVSFVHLFHSFLPRIPLGWISIILVDIYLFLLMLLAALRLPTRLPERQVALVTIPALLLILVMSFAELYIANGHIARLTFDNRVETLKEPGDAAYFSMVTITTLGYGDYTPQKYDARKLVIGELLSGGLLLFFAFPVLGSRLAQFEEATGTKIQRLDDGSWEIQEKSATPMRYPKSKRLMVTVGEQGMIDATSSD